MTSSKEAFQRNEELAKAWVTVCKSSMFGSVLIHARSAMMEQGCTAEMLIGANRFVSTMLDLPEQELTAEQMKGPALVHDLGINRNPQKK